MVFGVGYLLAGKYSGSNQKDLLDSAPDQSQIVTVENTPTVDGALVVPAGFPPDIPLEEAEILESATTYYPNEKAKQLSVSYRSLKTITQKYAEYAAYMSEQGYKITESGPNSPVNTILGIKESANLSIVIKSLEGKTLVELSYLSK